jgi:hypothetical protein
MYVCMHLPMHKQKSHFPLCISSTFITCVYIHVHKCAQVATSSVEQFAQEAKVMSATLQQSHQAVVNWAQHTIRVIEDEKETVAAFTEE